LDRGIAMSQSLLFICGLIILVGLYILGWNDGNSMTEKKYQKVCMEMYSDMPYNKVEDFCKQLLKFEKDVK
jgi:hypothetical protein